MTLKSLFPALTFAFALSAGFAQAADEASLTDAKKVEIETIMVEQGYEVRSIQIEHGLYEVYALKDGAQFEIYLDDTLTIVEGGEEE